MTIFIKPAENPIPSLVALLNANPTNEVSILAIVASFGGHALYVYASGSDPFATHENFTLAPQNLQEYHEAIEAAATPKTLVITDGDNALFVATVLGLVHRHNIGIQAAQAAYNEAMRIASEAAAVKFIAQAIIDYHFGINFGSDVQAGGASGPARRSKYDDSNPLPIADSISDSSVGEGI
jgi:hypothetical protein